MLTKCLRPLRLSLAATALSGSALLGGCTLGPNFHQPRVQSPSAFIADAPARTMALTTDSAINPEWWNSFNDPELTKLETMAVSQNLDVQIAAQRLAEARAQATIAGAPLYPSLSAAGSFTREKPSKVGIFSAFGGGGSNTSTSTNAGATASGGAQSAGGGGISGSLIQPFNLFQYGFSSVFDLDLWGKNRRALEAALATEQSYRDAERAALLNVEASLAQDYIQMRGIETVLHITRQNLKTAAQLVNLTNERQQAGLATSLDVANARSQQAAIAAQVPSLIAQRDSQIGQIGLLLGVTPQSLPAELVDYAPVPLTPASVPIGLPADLLRRRPDIRQAEAQLHAATAQVGVAVASFFPDISLSGSVSLQALQLSNLNSLNAVTYAIGPALSLPIFQGGELSGQLTLRKAQQKEAAINYAKTVLQAFYQADIALVSYNQEHARLEQLKIDAQQSQIAFGLAQDQYRQGLADYLQVLSAEQNLLNAQQSEAQSIETVSTDLVQLYQSLGGGWEAQYPTKEAGK